MLPFLYGSFNLALPVHNAVKLHYHNGYRIFSHGDSDQRKLGHFRFETKVSLFQTKKK